MAVKTEVVDEVETCPTTNEVQLYVCRQMNENEISKKVVGKETSFP